MINDSWLTVETVRPRSGRRLHLKGERTPLRSSIAFGGSGPFPLRTPQALLSRSYHSDVTRVALPIQKLRDLFAARRSHRYLSRQVHEHSIAKATNPQALSRTVNQATAQQARAIKPSIVTAAAVCPSPCLSTQLALRKVSETGIKVHETTG